MEILLIATFYVGLTPLARAEYHCLSPNMPADFRGDLNFDGTVDIFDMVIVARHFSFTYSYGDPNWDSRADPKNDGAIDIFDIVDVAGNFGSSEDVTPWAYATNFHLTVPSDGDEEVRYYVMALVYIPPTLSGQNFFFLSNANDNVQSIKLNNKQIAGSGASLNIVLGQLGQYYYFLEFEYVDIWASGYLNFNVTTTTGDSAWLARFRISVPYYTDATIEYGVDTYAYFSSGIFFLGGYADDYIKSLQVDGYMKWRNWEWDMGPNYGCVYACGDGFMYPLDYQNLWHIITMTFGDIWSTGILDFQFISQAHQPARIGPPKFWTEVEASNSQFVEVRDTKAWTGSDWGEVPGSSLRTISTTVRVLANITDDLTDTFYAVPQEAQISLTLFNLSSILTAYSYQDIALVVNLTYTYYIQDDLIYGMPIWFGPANVAVEMAEQDSMLYCPYPSLIFYNQTQTSFVTSEWKTVLNIMEFLSGSLVGELIGGGIIGWIGTGAYGVWWGNRIDQMISFEPGQILNWTQENLGPPTFRNFTMHEFKTTQDQKPGLSPVVKSICSVFIFHTMPFTSGSCGAVHIDLTGQLWLPFFYLPGAVVPGDWLPVNLRIQTIFPEFIQ